MTTFKSSLPFIALCASLVLLASSVSAKPPETCGRAHALETLKSGNYGELCGCNQITKSFIRALQRAPEFQSVLMETESSCASLSMLLTDPITASFGVQREGDDLRPDLERNSFSDPANFSKTASGERSRTANNSSSSKATSPNITRDESPQMSDNSPSIEAPSSDTNGNSGGIYNGW